MRIETGTRQPGRRHPVLRVFPAWVVAAWAPAMGCSSAPPVRPDPGPVNAAPAGTSGTSAVSADDPPYPWPSPMPEVTDPECLRSMQRLREGLGLEDDFWVVGICVSEKLPAAAVSAFGTAIEQHRQTARFIRVKRTSVPESLRADVDAEWAGAEKIGLYASAENQRKYALVEDHLGAGGWRGLCLPWNKLKGHSGVTLDAAVDTNLFSPNAVRLLADAAQDPDLFAWEDMAAHAQTPTDAQARPGDPKVAQAAFVTWVGRQIGASQAACLSGRADAVKRSLYWLGYATHGLEDLAAHRGRSNPEHAFNAYTENKSPDDKPGAERLARDMARTFLSRTVQGPLAPCAAAFASYNGATFDYAEKIDVLGLRRDLTIAALKTYKSSRTTFGALQAALSAVPPTAPGDLQSIRVRWFGGLDDMPAACDAEPACQALLDRVTGRN